MSDSDIINEFLIESHENLDQLDRDLVTLEQDPQNAEGLASIFRTFHTIKGACGFLNFSKLGAVTHLGENLLSRLRDGKLVLNPDIANALLALVDAVRSILANIEKCRKEGDGDYTELIARLTRLQNETAANQPAGCRTDFQSVQSSWDGLASQRPTKDGLELPPSPTNGSELQATQPLPDAPSRSISEGTIRVDVGLLDKLMNLVGELVLARNQVLQFTATQQDTTFLNTSQQLNLITTELQESVMKTRMQPIGNVWRKFPRLVRDLALACGKQVRLDLEGKETELDKTIIEAIKDPLIHLVRNAVDHGIEGAPARLALGKSAEGRLSLRAFHEGGQVNIEMADDGAGIDPDRIKRKALERGLVTGDQASRMTERELLQLIFLPGFSTAEKVTNLSGRGVGMDVVKTNIEKIGGTIDIQSQPGHGTTVKIKIPLTLAIIPALIVTSGGDRYAIPQVSLLELVRLEADQARRGIEHIHGAPVYRLRGSLLPLVYLNHALEVEDAHTGPEAQALNMVVLQADGRQFGLVVEAINDTEEIVVKPLGKLLKASPLFAGATIMGDGRVALILDVLGIAQRARVVSEVRDRTVVEKTQVPEANGPAKQVILLFGLEGERRMAIPLSQVARLEEIPITAVEKTAQRDVVQYRDEIMPLIRLGGSSPSVHPGCGQGPLQVVVYSQEGRSVGLVVDRIFDIVETPLAVLSGRPGAGILGSAVIQDRVTDLLDIPSILRSERLEGVEESGLVCA